MMVKEQSAIMIDEVREFSIDDTFAIFLIENQKEHPYFAAKISDISKVQNLKLLYAKVKSDFFLL